MVEVLARPRPRVVATMGTIISFDVRDPDVPEAAFTAAVDWLELVDRRFSPYRDQSEVSRLARAEIELDECHPDVRFVLTQCAGLHSVTGGFFNHRAAGLRAGFDPSGYVKGWAVEEAALLLEAAGARNYAINAGGDVVLRGSPGDGRPWVVGVRHPVEPDQVVARLAADPGDPRWAVATSGLYERPGHIVDPHTGRSPVELLSMTVVGPSLAVADAYATAAFAMGLAGLDWVARQPGYAGYAIDARLRPSWTADLGALLARSAATDPPAA